ncbi:MAG: hypothetical protein Q8O86_09215, partial [Dehalococcoidia bacterium]|nr:hypothetical protein [Dehalococcoidia bacterium]
MRRFALALFFVSWLVAAGLALAEGEIRVTSQAYENRFPKEIVFQLKAEADKEIKKITFFYRIGSSKSTSYAYPSFTPGRVVEVSYPFPT